MECVPDPWHESMGRQRRMIEFTNKIDKCTRVCYTPSLMENREKRALNPLHTEGGYKALFNRFYAIFN